MVRFLHQGSETFINYISILDITTMDFDKLCKDILDLDPKVRFAGVCDDSGEIKFGGQREGVTNLLSKEETKRSNLQAIARWALRIWSICVWVFYDRWARR